MKALISIIIPVYNTADYVVKSIASCLNQTYENVEVVVINDGSTDNSETLIQSNYKNNTRVKYCSKPNGGASSARNEGLKRCTGEYITFLDSDDIFLESALVDLYTRLIEEEADLSVPDRFITKGIDGARKNTQLYRTCKSCIGTRDFSVKYLVSGGTAWRCSSVLYKTSIIEEHNIHFEEGTIAEDYLFNLDYFAEAVKVAIVKSPTLVVQKREDSVTSSYHNNYLELCILLDKRTQEYLHRIGCSNIENIKYSNWLLQRNIVVYIPLEIKSCSAHGGYFKTYMKLKHDITSIERIREALNYTKNKTMMFSTRKGRVASMVILTLLKCRLLFLPCLLSYIFM